MIKLSEFLKEHEGIYSDPMKEWNLNDLENSLDEILTNTKIDLPDVMSRKYTFEVNDMKYELHLDILETENHKKIIEPKFYLLNNPKKPKSKDFETDQQYQIALKKSQVGITGTGNVFLVMDRVISILNSYCEKYDIDYITFTANEENRQRLYKSLIKRMIDKFGISYQSINRNPLSGEELDDSEFWLEKS